MFEGLFGKKPIRRGFVDIHCHIMPGVDDGSRDIEMSLTMARMAVENGTGTIIVTPHANQVGRFENYCTQEMAEKMELLKYRLQMAGIPLDVLPGMEIMASEDMITLLRNHLLCDLAGTGRYLVEFPFRVPEAVITRILKEMLDAGYPPILAHPERYVCVQDNPELVQQWRELGCMAQINKGSRLGGFGDRPRFAVKKLLAEGWVDLVGSDAHGVSRRTTDFSEFARKLQEDGQTALLKKIACENPQHLLRKSPAYR